jgi:hypothetical protein
VDNKSMFSFYDSVINNKIPTKVIEINELIDIIKHNPYQKDYKRIRSLTKGDSEYDELKRKLPRCHPNCVVAYNSLKGDNFERNFISGSGYIYLDIDSVNDIVSFKSDFINRHGSIVTMVCQSSGGNGLSIFIRINENIISHVHYKEVVTYIKTKLFSGIKFDPRTDRLGIPWFISHDPDVFFNPNAIVDVSGIEKCVNQGIIPIVCNNTLFYAENSIRYIPLNDIYSQIIIRTPYTNTNAIDINEVPWVDIKLPRVIGDTMKRNTYTRIIHSLFYLNPDSDPKWIFAYLYNVNRNCADPQMSYRDLLSLFNFQYTYIKSEDYCFKGGRLKAVHFDPNLNLTGHQKTSLANKINGARRSNNKKLLILETIQKIRAQGEKETVSAIHRKSGVTRNTIIKHLKDMGLTDLDELISSLLDEL